MKTIISYISTNSVTFECSTANIERLESLAFNRQYDIDLCTIQCDSIRQITDLQNILLPDMISSIYDLCRVSHWFYTVANLPPSYKTTDTIITFIESLKVEEQWRNFTTATDYALQEFRKRMLPYFNVDSKEWRASCQIAKNMDYPLELTTDEQHVQQTTDIQPTISRKKNKHRRRAKSANRTADKKSKTGKPAAKKTTPNYAGDLIIEPEDWNPETAVDIITVHTKNNNFLAMEILPIHEYKKTEQLANVIKILLHMKMERLAVKMFYYMLLNPKYCDVFRYDDVIKCIEHACQSLSSTVLYSDILQYAMYYSQYAMRHEETVMFSQVNPKYRILFTLEEALKFPIFHNVAFKSNPYIQQLTDDTNIRNTIPMYLQGRRELVDQHTFERRFRIATGGVFDGFNLQEINAAITGSILIPCVSRSPLERLYCGTNKMYRRGIYSTDAVVRVDDHVVQHTLYSNPYMTIALESQEDRDFFDYLEQYYPSYVSLTDADFEESVMTANLMPPNVSQSAEQMIDYAEIKHTDTDTDSPVRHSTVDEILWCCPSQINKGVNFNQLADIDCSITTESHEEFKRRAIQLYQHIRRAAQSRGLVYITEIRTISSIKYKIHGPGMCRPMDVFRVPYGPEKMVKKFHVQFVRQFYDGQLRMFRSCITSLLSGVSDTYRWFSCNKVPIDVILKYAQRGLSTILNTKERYASSAFLENDQRWGLAFKSMRMSVTAIYRPVTINHPFFMPDAYNCGIRMGLRRFGKNQADCVAIYPDIPEDQQEYQVKTNAETLMPKYTLIDQYCMSLGVAKIAMMT